jgi:hypothetical protein
MVSLELLHSQKPDSIALLIFTMVLLLNNHGHKMLDQLTLVPVRLLMAHQLDLNIAQIDQRDKLFKMVLQEL